MFDIVGLFRRAEELAPHGYCLLWDPQLVWTHVLADGLIAAAYFSIPLAIVRFVTARKDVEFSWIFWLFALFIVACGTTHLMGIWTLWHADYAWEAVIKVITAIASVGTAIVLWPLIPKALAIPSPLQLRQANEELGRRVAERDDALERLRREVAERERAEAALVQAQKMEAVGQLTGGIAHDFNNLLQAVAGTLELIVRNPSDPERVRRLAERGLNAAERGTRLTGQLLAFSRVQQLDLRPVPVKATVENMLHLIARSIGHGIEIRTDLPDAETAVVTDRTQLELALLNLVINARDAMPEGGVLTIAASPLAEADPVAYPEGAVEIRVADDGTGMPEEVRERAFEPFFTTKEVGKGTGLGLSMVYGVAKQSGGSVRIDSAPGEGTTIRILLPRSNQAAPADGQDRSVEPARSAGETVLIADDDEDVRATLRHSLETLGYRVVEAKDGPSALAGLERTSPDFAIFDYLMPGMTGAELARAAGDRRPDLKIAFASGYAETGALHDALGKDAAILHKPFGLADLAALLAGMRQGSRRT